MRRRRPGVIAAAAAAVAAAVVGIGVVRRGGGDGTIVARAAMEQMAPGTSGAAELVDRSDHLQLELTATGLNDDDGYYEVWLIDPTVTRLVSLGPIRADGVYDVPDGVDPRQFPVVDVSIEPVDGDPTHSGQSVLRGTLTF